MKKTLFSLAYGLLLVILVFLISSPSEYSITYMLFIAIIPILWKTLNLKQLEVEILFYFSALTLLLSYSLVGILNGTDIYGEYLYSSHTLHAHHWIPYYTEHSLNFVLPITITIPIVSLVSSIPLIIAIKTIPNLLYAIVYVLVYRIIGKLTKNGDIAFYSTYYFLIFPATWYVMPTVVRQEFALLSLVVGLYIIIIPKFNNVISTFLVFLLGINVVLSHYSTAIVYSIVGIICITSLFITLKIQPENKIKYVYKKMIVFTSSLILFWVLWYLLLYKTLPGIVTVELVKQTMDFSLLFKRAGIHYVSSTSVQNFAFMPSVILFGLSMIIIGIGWIVLSYKMYLIKNMSFLPYLVTSAFSVLLLVLGYSGSLGVIRTAGMILIVISPLFGYGLHVITSPMKNRYIIRYFPVLFLLFCLIVYSGIFSFFVFGISENPAITSHTESPKTWTTWPEYYGAIFLRANIPRKNQYNIFAPMSGLASTFATEGMSLNIYLGTWKKDINATFIPEDTLKDNTLWFRRGIASGIIYERKKFRESTIFQEMLKKHAIIYNSDGCLVSVKA